MKAIITRYLGPTNYKGSRYLATDEDGNRIVISADDALSAEQNRDAAALALVRKMDWDIKPGHLVRGYLDNDAVYVWYATHCLVHVPAAAAEVK